MMSTTTNWNSDPNFNICRTCLNKYFEEKMTSLFINSVSEKMTNADLLVECAAIQVLPHDGYPQNVCEKCLDKLISFYEFKKLCKQSEIKLKNTVNSFDFNNRVKQEIIMETLDIKDDHSTDDNTIKENHIDSDNEISNDALSNATNVLGKTDIQNNFSNVQNIIEYNNDDKQENNTINNKKCIREIARHICNYCSETFVEFEELQQHARMKHTVNLLFRCKICGEMFKLIQLFREHNKTHKKKLNTPLNVVTNPYLRKWECCKISFQNHIQLRRHLYKKHNKDLMYICSECKEEFNTIKELQKHMKMLRHSYVSPAKQNLCWICGKMYTYANELEQHLFIHNGLKPYKCNDCDKSFSCKVNLKSHRTVHTQKIKRTCNVCGKLFTRVSAFTQHMKIHTGEYKHQCSLCNKKFIRQRQLTEHMISHTGARDYECDFCGKTFGRKRNLVTHRYIHTGEKRKICNICGEAFIQTTSLHLHMKKHQKNNC